MFVYIYFIFITFACLSSCYGLFQIRKCCKENEHIGSKLNCVPNGNITFDNENWPWWFPNETKIVSVETNIPVDGFPADAKVATGIGAPCCSSQSSYLFSFNFYYDFFDDGSIKVFKNDYQIRDVTYPPHSYCVDRLVEIEYNTTIDYVVQLCPCQTTVCVLKCCESGMILEIPQSKVINDRNCMKDPQNNSWLPEMENYFILNRFPKCVENEELVITDISNLSSTRMHDNGSVWLYAEPNAWATPLQYCGENILYDNKHTNSLTTIILRCLPATKNNVYTKVRRLFYASLSSIGAIFLILTLLTYALLPRELTVNDKNLIAQTWSLLVGYLGIAISQFAVYYLPHSLCVAFGLIILYSFLASFFWLNVLCIDLAWAFSELRLIRSLMVWQNRRRYLQYSLYAWLSPAIIVTATIIVDFAPNIPASIIKPEFSEFCWFRNDSLAKFSYFYGPIAVLLVSNIILFLYTALKIRGAQKQASTLLQNNAAHEKKRTILYLKLFCLMGLSWVLELVSWVVGGPEYYWYGTDMVNLFRALFIFITLCWKREVFEELRVKFQLADRQGRRTASPSVVTLTSQYQPTTCNTGGEQSSSQSPHSSSSL